MVGPTLSSHAPSSGSLPLWWSRTSSGTPLVVVHHTLVPLGWLAVFVQPTVVLSPSLTLGLSLSTQAP